MSATATGMPSTLLIAIFFTDGLVSLVLILSAWHDRSTESLSHEEFCGMKQTDGGPFGLGLLIALGPFGLRNPTRCGGTRRCDEKIGTPCSGTDILILSAFTKGSVSNYISLILTMLVVFLKCVCG